MLLIKMNSYFGGFVRFFCVLALVLLNGCDYSSYDECISRELQKFQYEPSWDDRFSVQEMCEMKHPYEKELFDIDFKWYGETISVDKNSDYNITKINIYAFKDKSGSCNTKPDSTVKLEYLFFNKGATGASSDWKPEYTCYFPNKSEVFGIRKKN
ncbi:hypothetical protein DBT82_RS17205 [Vibrio parahaemolyticus]|uniref:hypothetical protein n=1 Tax=Vibrio parahaemolyticus TaxID=670 RepID=UPI0008139809|nr:hypothetical protein [Vibrio parahaemolyticus]EGQ8284353.1 hypothetical protein [Vibrio parahaemolyticus]EGQ8334045.1 hypothetical protein [Vibrio parahaemolyticus]EGR0696925.1 hypothetical protein [Vibrio parahaemolyticus]EGR2010529.1 hypothetical protein [Vibrio parahaemolyticus]EGR2036758.1 hypothetical protein [Vibrio parahaemolyticus]